MKEWDRLNSSIICLCMLALMVAISCLTYEGMGWSEFQYYLSMYVGFNGSYILFNPIYFVHFQRCT